MTTALTFPAVDPVGPADASADVNATVIRDVIAPSAAEVDVAGVPRSHIDALAAAGLLGAPLQPKARQREAAELISGSDASTWFCWTQHQSPLSTLEAAHDGPLSPAASRLQEQYLAGMRDGSLLNAVAFAHVRRPGPANPSATRVEGGWVLNGTLDWVTSWDIADVVMVLAQGVGEFSDRFIAAYLPAGRTGEHWPNLEIGEPLRLLAMSGTHTRPIRLKSSFVPDECIAAVLDRAQWLADDAQRTADANPSAFGVARGAIAELSVIAESRSDSAMQELVEVLTQECASVRAEAYALTDDADRVRTRHRRLELRARSLHVAATAATSVVVARAGAAMLEGASAGRRVREAMFLQVQAQTADTREASLRLLAQG